MLSFSWRLFPAVLAAGLLTALPSALPAANPAHAVPVADAATTVTVRLDPSYQEPAFQGWGTSLAWFANVTGGYPEEIRRRLVDLVFGADGLDLNIARYNIGGGNAPNVDSGYMKPGSAVPGFWAAPAGTSHADKDWWNPDDPADWNWAADANQRWWIDQIKNRVDRWEAFSNSPPYFQTVSGYVSGSFTGSDDQIRADRVEDFATYLVRVAEYLERAHGIRFDTIEPLNEANTSYWKTTLDANGRPVGGRQEGAHASPELQQQVVVALHKALAGARTHAVVSAMDETNPGIFGTNWTAYSEQARAAVGQLNVHTYGTGQRTSVRDLAKSAQKPLWMSEVEGSFLAGTSYTSMEPGLGIANRIVGDLHELEPSAWVLWQPIEDGTLQQAGNGNWGSIHIPFNCTATDTLQTCPIRTNTKFDTIRNFTHYVRPGDHVIKVDDPNTMAAVPASGNGATAVHVNSGTVPHAVTLDLADFDRVAPGATVTPIVTSSAGALVRGAPVPVDGRRVTVTVPAKSVTTLLVAGVSGVAGSAALVQPDHTYRIQGRSDGRSLASADGVVAAATDAAAVDQLWTIRKLSGGVSNRARYAITDAHGTHQLAVRSGALTTEDSQNGTPDLAAQWLMSTSGDGTWTLVNAAGGLLVTAGSGSEVVARPPNSSAGQRWRVIDETALGTVPAKGYTVPGRAPLLPRTVVPVHRDGAGGTLPVTWDMPRASAWRSPGTVRVPGRATDPLGRTVPAVAVVTVDVFTATEPARAKAYVGGQPDLPRTVVGLGRFGGRAELPVIWTATHGSTAPGVYTVGGVATVLAGTRLPATLRVQVTAPVEVNAALDAGVEVAATYTEDGYSADGLRDGELTAKAWSNWRPGTQNASDTITFTLPVARDLTRVRTYFYRDSASGGGLAASLKVQARAADGTWRDASGEVAVPTTGAPVVDVPVTAAVANGVRVVLTPAAAGYLTVSEIQAMAKVPGVSSNAAAARITVDGRPVAGFTADGRAYRVKVVNPGRATVTATGSDPYARVTVTHRRRGTAQVTVTREDGTQSRTYTIDLVPRGRWWWTW